MEMMVIKFTIRHIQTARKSTHPIPADTLAIFLKKPLQMYFPPVYEQFPRSLKRILDLSPFELPVSFSALILSALNPIYFMQISRILKIKFFFLKYINSIPDQSFTFDPQHFDTKICSLYKNLSTF